MPPSSLLHRAGLAALVVVGACASGSPTDLDPGQEILFHVSYENHAWGYQNSGWYVDRDGEVWSMAPAPMWPGEVSMLLEDEQPAGTYSAAEIEAEYMGARDSLLLVLAPDEVQEMARLVGDAAAGGFSDVESTAADAGLFLNGALLYDPEGRTYRRIVLSIRGDWTVLNESSAAARLAEWLAGIAVRIADG
jgi:hypothetical protein